MQRAVQPAVQQAQAQTAAVYESKIVELETRHEAEIVELTTEIAEQRQLNRELQDQLCWHEAERSENHALTEAYARVDELQKNTTVISQLERIKELAELKGKNRKLQVRARFRSLSQSPVLLPLA